MNNFKLLGQTFEPYVMITVISKTGHRYYGSIESINEGVVSLRPKHGHGEYHYIALGEIEAVTRNEP